MWNCHTLQVLSKDHFALQGGYLTTVVWGPQRVCHKFCVLGPRLLGGQFCLFTASKFLSNALLIFNFTLKVGVKASIPNFIWLQSVFNLYRLAGWHFVSWDYQCFSNYSIYQLLDLILEWRQTDFHRRKSLF